MGPFMTRALRRSAVILGLIGLALAAVPWLRTGAAIPVTLGASLADRCLDAICTGHGGCTPPGEARAMLAAFLAEG